MGWAFAALAALLMRAIAARSQAATDCKEPPRIIDDHASAMMLTEAARCPDQNITVKWRGFVNLTEPIIVAAGTSLVIDGVSTDSGPGAISGQNKTQLLRVRNGASVTLRNLWLRDGLYETDSDDGGGAIRIFEHGRLILEACQFLFNRVVAASSDSTSYTFNVQADASFVTGGAVYNSGNVNCHSCIFANNLSDAGGGAISNDGVFTCDNSTFTSNTAQNRGGGAISNSGNFTCRTSTFTSNTVAGGAYGGGAIYNSGTCSCNDSTFTSNTAAASHPGGGVGGAIVNTGEFTCNSSTFTSNTGDGGGAIFNVGNFTCNNSTFTSNTATGDKFGGGAILTIFGNFVCISSSFTSNTAGNASGGAIGADGTLFCYNSTFTTNSAQNGGAVYLQDIDAHLVSSDFHGNTATFGGTIMAQDGSRVRCSVSRFERNKAITGGTVYAVARSTLEMSSVVIGYSDSHEDGAIFAAGNVSIDSSRLQHNSGRKGAGMYLAQDAVANISRTSLSFNTATVTGGALYLEAAVNGYIETCSFLNNSSPVGGALSLESASDTRNFSISDSVFAGNIASVGAGGAIVQQGTATVLGVDVVNSTFSSNDAQCCYDGVSSGGGLSCVDASTGYGTGWSCCNDRQYLATDANNEHICVTCDLHELNCTSIGITVHTLPLASGFWRETFDQQEIRTCWNAGACKGGEHISSTVTSVDAYCSAGYTGPYCAVCAPGYARLPGYRCIECTSSATAATLTVLGVVALAILLLVWLLFSKSTGVGDGMDGAQTVSSAGLGLKVARVGVLLMQRFRIPIVVLQVLTQYISITGLSLPLQYLEFLRALDFMSLDMRWLTSPGCAADINFYDRLLVATLAPLAITALIFSPRFYLWLISRRTHAVAPKLRRVVARDVDAFLVFSFLIFSGVSLTVFETFGCDELKYIGKSYLRADYSLECDDDEGLHTKFSIYAAFMIAVYPVGIPVLYASILWRAAMRQRDRTQLPSRLASPSSFLWRPYKGRAYYWETAECLRRLMLAGLLVFIMPGSPGQSAFACMLAFFTAMVYEQVRPHQERRDKWLYTLGYGIVVCSMFTSLLMQVQWVEGDSERAIGNLLIALNVLLLVIALAQVALVYSGVRTAAGPVRQNSLFDRYSESLRNTVRGSTSQIDDATSPSSPSLIN